MAGSRKWFVYTTDAGDTFAANLDESNVEAVNGATGDFVDATTVSYALPRNVKMRSLEYVNAGRTIRRKIPAMTAAIYAAANAGDTITDAVSNTTLTLVRKVGEIVSVPFAADTGLQDGDAT